MLDGNLKNILVIGVGIHLITRTDLIEAGIKITEILPEDFFLNLDVKNDVEFELTEVDFPERPKQPPLLMPFYIRPEDHEPLAYDSVKPKVSKPWYRQNEKY